MRRGSWKVRIEIAVPRRMRRVRCESAASITAGSGTTPYSWKWCSAQKKVS
jgi:hypothetical protein